MDVQSKKIVAIVRNSTLTQCFLYIVIMLLLFMGVEKLKPSTNYTNFFNFLFGVLLFIILRLSIVRHRLQKKAFLVLVSGVFVINRFYDAAVVESLFHIPMNLFGGIIGGTALGILLFPCMLDIIWGILKESEETDKSDKVIKRKRTTKYREKTEKVKSTDGMAENLRKEYNKEAASVWKGKSINEGNKFWNGVRYILIFLVLLTVPAVLYYVMVKSTFPLEVQKLAENSLGAGISIVVPYLFLILLTAAFTNLLLRTVRTINNTILGKKSNVDSILYASVLLGIVLFIYQNDIKLTQDSVLDMLANGDIFSFPLILVVLLPILSFFVDSMMDLLGDKNDTLKEIKEPLKAIVRGIILALLNLIRFVTADFLGSLIIAIQ